MGVSFVSLSLSLPQGQEQTLHPSHDHNLASTGTDQDAEELRPSRTPHWSLRRMDSASWCHAGGPDGGRARRYVVPRLNRGEGQRLQHSTPNDTHSVPLYCRFRPGQATALVRQHRHCAWMAHCSPSQQRCKQQLATSSQASQDPLLQLGRICDCQDVVPRRSWWTQCGPLVCHQHRG